MGKKNPTLEEVYGDLKLAIVYAHDILTRHGQNSEKFKTANARMNDLVQQANRVLLGSEG